MKRTPEQAEQYFLNQAERDPYSFAVRKIQTALDRAFELQGKMSEGEYLILSELRMKLETMDPAAAQIERDHKLGRPSRYDSSS